MSTPLIIWSCVVVLFVIIVLAQLLHAASYCSKNKGKILSYISEREEFFIPGDPDPQKADDYDFEDFDNL